MPETTLEVDVSQVLNRVEPRVLGINVNYLVDHDANRPAGARPLLAALREMGPRSLRYPGGNKSDSYLWSQPPFARPRPAVVPGVWPAVASRVGAEPLVSADGKTFRTRPLDFDRFMRLCRRLHAEPTLVICYDSLHDPRASITRREIIQTAAAWVRYANVDKGYGVSCWEIGNESYLDANVRVEDYVGDLIEIARAMKAADPTIKIGATGPNGVESPGSAKAGNTTPWWQEVFAAAGDLVDVAVAHIYPCWEWRGYEAYRSVGPDVAGPIDAAFAAARRWGPPGLAERLRVAVTELNSADWSQGGWPTINNLGHALVLFDIIGSLLEHPRLDMAQVWNTRWVSHKPDEPSLWDAVDDCNQLQPTGRALAIWTRFVGDQMVRIGQAERVRAFASYSPAAPRLTIFLLNKDAVTRDVSVALAGYRRARVARRWTWSGEGPEDLRPTWSDAERLPVSRGEVALALPADSLTVVELGGRTSGGWAG